MKSDDAFWPDTSVGVHPFLTFDDELTDPAAIRQGAAAFGFVWGAAGIFSNGSYADVRDHTKAWHSANPNVVLSSYMSFINADGVFPTNDALGSRARGWPNQAAQIEHWNRTHPDWILYQCDKKTPTLMVAADGNACEPPGNNKHGECQVHLDFTNPAVQRWQFEHTVPLAAAAGYDAMAIDNFDLIDHANLQQACGVWRNGSWVQLFSGELTDRTWLTAVLDWLRRFTSLTHAVKTHRGVPMRTVVNFGLEQSALWQTPTAAAVANATDAVL